MELLNRYRNVTVLLLVIFAQLLLLAYQVKGNQDVRLIRVWAVTAITPLARVAETVRAATVGFAENYIFLHNLREENQRLKEQVGRLKLDNEFLKSQVETADRVAALNAFQARNPSRTVVSRVIGTGTGTSSRVVFIDRGSAGGVMRGMAVITPDGIVGKIVAAYPTASQVLLVTDPTFAAGVISQKHRVRGTVRGTGHGGCIVDYIQNEQQVDPGEQFFTSGDDGLFPKGLPVGAVTVTRPDNPYKKVFLEPSGMQGGLEEVLIILEGVHQPIPEPGRAASEVHLQPLPSDEEAARSTAPGATPSHLKTEADRLRERYQRIGEAQGHVFGTGLPGSKPPDFNLKPEDAAAKAARAAQAQAGAPPPGAAAPKPTGPATAQPAKPGARPQTAAPQPEAPPSPETKPRPATPAPAAPPQAEPTKP